MESAAVHQYNSVLVCVFEREGHWADSCVMELEAVPQSVCDRCNSLEPAA